MTTVTGLGTITSNYGHLNGVQSTYYGNYGYGYYGYSGVNSTANAEQAKERIADNYDVNATWQGYRSKQGVETINYSQQCSVIAQDLKNGETDQASERFQEMVDAMKNSPQYANYSDSEICALIRNQYATTTGSDLVVDINKQAASPFFQGFKRGTGIGLLFANKNSSADLVAQVTNNSQSKGEKTARILGTTTGAAAGAGAVVGTIGLLKRYNGFEKIKNSDFIQKLFKGNGKWAAIAVGAITGVTLIASIIKGIGSKNKTNS